MDALRHKQAEVRAVAATTLPAFDRSPHAAQDLAEALADSSDEVRIAAAGALSGFAGVDDETLVFDLTKALNDDERLVVFNAARSLTAYGDAGSIRHQNASQTPQTGVGGMSGRRRLHDSLGSGRHRPGCAPNDFIVFR